MSDTESYSKDSQSSTRSINFAAEANNFMEIVSDFNNEDDDIEYVDYPEEDNFNGYIVVEGEEDEEIENDLVEYTTAQDKSNEHDDVDHGIETNPADAEQNEEDMYHCSTCNMNFHSVEDHVNQYHKDQTVLYNEADASEEVQESEVKKELGEETEVVIKQEDESQDLDENLPIRTNVKVKAENIDDLEFYCFPIESLLNPENMDVAEVEYLDEAANGILTSTSHNENEEMFFDATGRPYIRKKVKIEDVKLENYARKSNVASGSKRTDNNELFAMSLNTEGTPDEPNGWLMCPKCQRMFETERRLASHMRLCGKSLSSFKLKTTKNSETVTCEECNTVFPSNKSYRLHARMHGPVRVRPLEEAIGYEMKSSMKDGKKPNETFFCDICNKSYDISFQEVHRKSHKVGPTFICTICNKKFANQVNLDMHLKAHQENPKVKPPTKAELTGTTLPYECSYCFRQFARPHEKVKHERIHTGEKPYKCEICGKSFRVAYCLTLHLRTHTSARPYVCPHCNKRYKAYSGYNHHLMTHSDERPYKCPHCPKAFKTSVQLAGHKNSHTKPFSCPECNRPFASLYAVKAHMETHQRSGQTLKHKCPICGAIYARVFALKDHMKEQHQTNFTEGDEAAEINISQVVFMNSTEASVQSILPGNVEEITIDEMDHFQTEEVVTDWLK